VLSLEQLRDYNNWIGVTAQTMLDSAIAAGGWGKVFPDSSIVAIKRLDIDYRFPYWAHRVRNYFNDVPGQLKRLPKWEAYVKARNALREWSIQGALELTDYYAYQDPAGRTWFQTTPGATVYHYRGEAGFGKAFWATHDGQAQVPVFKLLSPDGSGGSCELIVHNPPRRQIKIPMWDKTYVERRWTLGEEGKWIPIGHLLVTDVRYTGSYNYSETFEVGYDAHVVRDVKPHERWPKHYLEPPNLPLNKRKFPKFDPAGKPIADAIWSASS
jgi:hypothetical protein